MGGLRRLILKKVSDVKHNLFILAKSKEKFLLDIGACNKELIVYGVSGKGSVIAMQLVTEGLNLTCFDSDPRKRGLYREGSGIRVVLPSDKHLSRCDSVIVVSNCKHKEFVKTFFHRQIVTTDDCLI